MSRTVTLVLVDAAGTQLGALAPFAVPSPWWPDAAEVVAGARERHGVDVTVLRLLTTERAVPHGGAVTYLAQVARAPAVSLDPVRADLAAHPLRAPWAEPGGPDRSLAWAAAALGRLGRGAHTAAQQRAWNLSAIWRLTPARPAPEAEDVWLKQVPFFFAHEAEVLRWLGAAAPHLAPDLLADDGTGRMLLAHVWGQDRYEADIAERDAIAARHHDIQLRASADVPALISRGVPDRRGVALAVVIRRTLAADGADLSAVERLMSGLDDRLAAVARCGLPDTLVHGDLHPGNVRGDGQRHVIIDWGDAFVGHPAFDILRLTEDLEEGAAAALTTAWARRWRASVPGCDPERAVELLRPVAALRNAAVYANFLAQIEPSERPFHAADVPAYLARAAAADGVAQRSNG